MKQLTEDWWQRCLEDESKLEHWLVSLYNNEKDAEERFIDFATKYCQNDKNSYESSLKLLNKKEIMPS